MREISRQKRSQAGKLTVIILLSASAPSKFDPTTDFISMERKRYFRECVITTIWDPLGAAVNDAAIRRQVRIMKDMGVNAIRTSHNMPAPELVRAYDEMGMMLMVETFDEWKMPKVANGYNLSGTYGPKRHGKYVASLP